MGFPSNKDYLATNPEFYFLGKKAKVLQQPKNIVKLKSVPIFELWPSQFSSSLSVLYIESIH